ncbi:NAD(P)H-binding protein [Kitasatospora azatica]|uniref:NAD(P)H-binding protein n=1 Tax=Kitasatospora azatica TaxID=58347 RepID=UPI00056B63DD|nr:NAD(P)H-binding protein [Kitasatospora azatica]
MILVTGATGTVGREVARQLAARGPVRVLVRDPGRLAVTGPQLETVRGSYADGAALDRALTGVTAAFLVTNHPSEPDDERFVRAARAAGLGHLVKLSAFAVGDPTATDFITRRQRANEQLIRDSGLRWTFLRPRAFMANALAWAGTVRAEGVVRAQHGGAPQAVIDPRDLAEVAVRVLTEPGHQGRSYQLTGPEPISAREQTALLGSALGRPLRFEELTEQQAREQLTRRYPAVLVEALLQSAQQLAAGRKARVDPTTEQLLGRRPTGFRQWAVDHASAFAWDADREAWGA